MTRSGLWRIAVLTAATLATTPALAGDARLVARRYNPDEVIRIEGRAGVQATISFGNDEHIENVAIGNSNSWQVTPNKRANVLFVKPLQARARTNLTVITDQHSYFFDLVASPTAQAIYALRFSYPHGANAPRQSQALAPAQPAGAERTVDPSKLNFAWRTKGDSSLLPSRIYDDGSSVFLTWRQGARLPAILVRNQKGEEGPVNFTVRGDTMVVEGVPRQIVLRAGKDSATIENRAPTTRPAVSTAQRALASRNSQGS